jgi:hypothetical protein
LIGHGFEQREDRIASMERDERHLTAELGALPAIFPSFG